MDDVPKRSNEFQRLVFLINACLAGSGTIRESEPLVDRTTGEEREVDIVVTTHAAGSKVTLSIEVSGQSRRAGSPWVEEMHGKHQHLATDKLVLVSKSGFTRNAVWKADFLGIETLTIEEALETDWDLVRRMTEEGTFVLTKIRYECAAEYSDESDIRSRSPISLNTTVYLPYREIPTDISNMVGFFLNEPTIRRVIREQMQNASNRTLALEYSTHTGTYILESGGAHRLMRKLFVDLHIDQSFTSIRFAIRRFRDTEVAYAVSADADQLYFALVKKNNGEVEGRLYHEDELRALNIEAEPV